MATDAEITEKIIENLKLVNDPELGIDIYNLGLVYDISVDEDRDVKITFTLTSMGCPVGPMIEEQIREVCAAVEGVGDVTTEITLYPPWSPEKMTPLARSALGVV
jgi:metal-sulfur cluster biosynthetic enzyme